MTRKRTSISKLSFVEPYIICARLHKQLFPASSLKNLLAIYQDPSNFSSKERENNQVHKT